MLLYPNFQNLLPTWIQTDSEILKEKKIEDLGEIGWNDPIIIHMKEGATCY